jgi:AmmeMemoRadiSam system protein A
MTAVLAPADGALLARLAADAVGVRLAGQPGSAGLTLSRLPPATPAVCAPGASFVTLERRGALRGCVGTLEAMRPLYRDVIRNALRASVDPRLPPVTADDWPDLDVKVSVLSAPEPLTVHDLDQLIAALQPGVHGVILGDGPRRSTFLPAVWHKLPDPARFVDALLAKGGWPPGVWPAGLKVRLYTSTEFRDGAPREELTA